MLEEMREMYECDMKERVTLDSSAKTIPILGDKLWPQAAKQEGDTFRKHSPINIWKPRTERPVVGGVSIRVRNGNPSRKGCVVNDGQMTKARNK